jgi:hypothetical protein
MDAAVRQVEDTPVAGLDCAVERHGARGLEDPASPEHDRRGEGHGPGHGEAAAGQLDRPTGGRSLRIGRQNGGAVIGGAVAGRAEMLRRDFRGPGPARQVGNGRGGAVAPIVHAAGGDDAAIRQGRQGHGRSDELPARRKAGLRDGRIGYGAVIGPGDADRRRGEKADGLDRRTGNHFIVDEGFLPHAIIEHFNRGHIVGAGRDLVGAGAAVSVGAAEAAQGEGLKDFRRRLGPVSRTGCAGHVSLAQAVVPAPAIVTTDQHVARLRRRQHGVGKIGTRRNHGHPAHVPANVPGG